MPLVRKIEPGLWEARSTVSDGAVRILFTVDGETMLLLHAFAKESRKMPLPDLAVARRRLAQARRRGVS